MAKASKGSTTKKTTEAVTKKTTTRKKATTKTTTNSLPYPEEHTVEAEVPKKSSNFIWFVIGIVVIIGLVLLLA